MDFYIWIWAISLLISLLPKKSKILYIIWGLILVIIDGGRELEVGIDTFSYYEIYNKVGNGDFVPWVEPIWNLLCWVSFSFVSRNFNVFMFFIASITIFNFMYVIYKNSPYPFLSVFIFISLHMYTGSFNIMRQYFAMSFLILSWHFYNNFNRKKSLLALIVSVFSHYSTIFSCVFYFWNRLSLSDRKIYILLLIALILGSAMNESALSVFTGSLFANFLEKDTVFRDNSAIMIIMVIAQNILAFVVVYLTKEQLKSGLWFKLFVLSCLVFNVTYMVAYAARFYLIFSMCQLIFIPLFLKQIKARYRIVGYTVFIIYMSAQFFRILIPNGNGILPYNSYLIQ